MADERQLNNAADGEAAEQVQTGAKARMLASRVAHALKWVLAIAGVFLAVSAIQVTVAVYGSIWLARLDRFGADGSAAIGDVLAIGVATQLAWLAIALPWWRHVRRRGMGIDPVTVRQPVAVRYGRASDVPHSADTAPMPGNSEFESAGACPTATGGESPAATPLPIEERRATRHPVAPVRAIKTLLAIVLMGIGLQIVISLLITLTLPLFPEVEREYTELMESSGTDVFTPLSVLSVAVLAPIVEELTFRGIAFQFALRAVTPAWNKRLVPRTLAKLPVSRMRFWVANALQALAFAITHLNITQGLYAFAIGLVLGWLFGRTGQLRYGIALHLAINFSSYFVEDILGVFGLFGDVGVVALSVVCAVVGTWLFVRLVPALSWSVEARLKSL